MSDSVRNALFAASRRLLVPLARLLMKQGVSADELKILVDQACVQAAQDQLTERGAVVTASRITAITGQPRYLVSSALAAGEKTLPVKRTLRASYSQRVLTGFAPDCASQSRRRQRARRDDGRAFGQRVDALADKCDVGMSGDCGCYARRIAVAINGECRACRHAMLVRLAQDERAHRPHFRM